ncbi:hypothetical protein GSH19_01660 [Lactobacillus sp. S2-2]|uniref:DUF1831 domain-containing protein n=1 Tax=Lactobacillus sp. S2-2 TaxID=2692917 RepID=UPI001F301783|nr:DUF1831 domain-containing protein [Lactobacillus sp. S2-2]MCF6514869.1 hypothetical protein [Lactobacillus sp. S2-2]
MAFSKEIKLKGDINNYELSPEIKKYTLRDLGFTTTKLGNFVYKINLDPNSPFNSNSIKLKITVNDDLTAFKMAILDSKELKEVDIFNNDKFNKIKEQLDFNLENMITRKVIVKK